MKKREAPVIEMMHAVGKEAAPDSHPSIVQMSYKCDIVITGQQFIQKPTVIIVCWLAS